jgi:hypothetical protein
MGWKCSTIGEARNAYNTVIVKSEWKRPKDLGIDGRMILTLICKEEYVRLWTVFTWLRIGSSYLLL